MKKTTTALLVAASVLFSSAAAVQAETNDQPVSVMPVDDNSVSITNTVEISYKDLGDHYSKKTVHRLVKMGLLANKDSEYKPQEKIKRAEIKAWLEKALGVTLADNNPSGDEFVRRAEVAQWVASALPPMNTGIMGGSDYYPYTDTDSVSAEGKKSLKTLYNLGLMVGDGNGKFNPQHGMTRGEAAVLLENILDRSLQAAKTVSPEKVETLPETVYTLVQENKSMAGVYSVTEDGYLYVVVMGGEVGNAGYSVALDSLMETDAGLFVKASLKKDKDRFSAEVISYPYHVFKVKDNKKSVYLLD